jgi:hypothetical protein
LGEQRYTVPEFGNSFNRLVQICIGHGVLWCRGLMTGWLGVSPSSPCTFRKTEINLVMGWSRRALAFSPQ